MERHTETTASIASLAAIIVSATLLATESSSLTSAVAAFIHGAITRDMANLTTYDKTTRETYIYSNRNLHCAWVHLVEDRLPVEDTPWRDVQFRRSDSKPCSLGVRDNRGKDVQPLFIGVSTGQENNTPSLKGRG